MTVLFLGLTDLPVQLLFIFRAWKRESPTSIAGSCLLTFHHSHLSVSNKNSVLTGCFILLVLAQFVATVVLYSELQPTALFIKAGHSSFPLHTLWAGAVISTSVDIALALALVVLLYRCRTQIPFGRTRSIIDRIMMYSVGSGLLTAAFALAGLLTSLLTNRNFIFIVLMEMLPKRELKCTNRRPRSLILVVYVNCLLTSCVSDSSCLIRHLLIIRQIKHA